MPSTESVFDQTYEKYLVQLQDLPLAAIAPKIGAEYADKRLWIPLFDRVFEISPSGITGQDGKRPSYDVCVILSKYLLLFTKSAVRGGDWVSFRDFKDSRPLHNYFANEVERAIASHFSGNIDALKMACKGINGYLPDLPVAYDLAMQFDALPNHSVILLVNDADTEFPAQCTVLFPAHFDGCLDAECIAMVGFQLFSRLKHVAVR
jgi:Domain of unknown function (DUF3786)